MFCKNCGKEIKVGNQFCNHCGQKLEIGRFFLLISWFRNHGKKIFVATCIVILFIFIFFIFKYFLTLSATKNISTEQLPYNDILIQTQVASSVVNLFCYSRDGSIGAGGSGTMMSKEGVILTNYHVIAKTDFCLVTIPNSTTGVPNEMYIASPIVIPKLSEEYDIAMLEIVEVYTDQNGTSYGVYPNTFSAFTRGKDCTNYIAKLGDDIKIYGYPVTSGGSNLTITDGILSSFTDDGLILTSAKVDSGNSGGIAVSKNGCFVGIPSAVETGKYQNLGVLIPSDIILDFIDKAGTQYSK
jgi:hypothetical protein